MNGEQKETMEKISELLKELGSLIERISNTESDGDSTGSAPGANTVRAEDEEVKSDTAGPASAVCTLLTTLKAGGEMEYVPKNPEDCVEIVSALSEPQQSFILRRSPILADHMARRIRGRKPPRDDGGQ